MGFPQIGLQEALVYDVRAYGAVGDEVQDDTAAITSAANAANANGGGVVYAGPGKYVAQGLPLYSNVRYMGAGAGATTFILPSAATDHLFYVQIPASGSLLNSGISDMTIDGTNAGYYYGVLIDASANASIVEQGSIFARLRFQNCYVGWYHGANNASAGAMSKKTILTHSEFYNCAVGAFGYGTYGDSWDHLFASGCTLAGIGTYGAFFLDLDASAPQPGAGPTTVLSLDHIHVEGLGNFASGTDAGILINCSALRASGLEISNTSLNAAAFGAQEPGICNVIEEVNVWGTGGGISLVAAANAGEAGVLKNFSLSSIGRNTGNWNGGYAQRQDPLFVVEGKWDVGYGKVSYYSSGLCPYNVVIGSGAGSVGRATFNEISFPTAGTAFMQLGDTSAIVRFSNCEGLNPTGSAVPGTAFALPASGTAWTNNTGVDGTLHVTAAGTVTDVVVQGVTVGSSLAVGQSFFVPAGGTIAFTYSVAPTLVFVGN